MPYDPHTISLEADLSTLAEHPHEDVGEETVVLGSVALVRSLECKTPDGPIGATPPG